MFVKDGAVAHKAFEGYQDRRDQAAGRRRHHLSLGVDHQDVHRRRDHAAARSRPAVARRSGGEVRARAARGPQPVRRHLAGHDPSPDDAQRRLPRRHVAVGRRSAVASVRADALGAGGRDDAVHRAAVPAGHQVQLLESRRHLSRAHHRAVLRRRLRGLHQQEHLHAARHDAQLLRSRAVSPGRAPIAQLRRRPTTASRSSGSTSTAASPCRTAA